MSSREWNHVLHFVFPGLFVAKTAKGKTSTSLSYVTSEHSAYQTNFRGLRVPVDSTSKRNVPASGSLSGTHPYNSDVLQLTSRQNVGRGRFDRPAGSRGEGTQTYPHAEIVRLPSGSIVSIGPFETLDPSQASFNRPFVFAFRASLMLWGLIGVAVWLLVSAIR